MDAARASFKVVLVGSSGVGKSRLLERFTRNDFSENSSSTYGVEYATKRVAVGEDGETADLKIWDTAGQRKYRAITTAYYTGAAGVLLVYDVAFAQSFEECAAWLAEIRAHAATGVPVVLVGNKVDLAEAGERAVEQDDARAFAEEHDLGFVECSARSGFGVAEAFGLVAGAMWEREQAAVEAAAAAAAIHAMADAQVTGGARGGGSSSGAASPAAADAAATAPPRARRGCCCLCCWALCCCCCTPRHGREEAAALLADARGPTGPTRRKPPPLASAAATAAAATDRVDRDPETGRLSYR